MCVYSGRGARARTHTHTQHTHTHTHTHLQKHEVTKDYDVANYFYDDGELANGNLSADVEDLVSELVKLANKGREPSPPPKKDE
jgi:hypothetical protein